uniref:Reverse transcriptase domain-containing protein n=1 Tax=Haemonchus contortus TaxID=6289 RepID=A0A7I5EEN2_HAECO
MPLSLTLIDLKKAFDTVETEAVIGALDNQDDIVLITPNIEQAERMLAQFGIRSFELRHLTKIRIPLTTPKNRRVIADWILRDVKRTPGRPTTRWSRFFSKTLNKRNAGPRP